RNPELAVAVEQLHAAQLTVLNELGPELEVKQRSVPRRARSYVRHGQLCMRDVLQPDRHPKLPSALDTLQLDDHQRTIIGGTSRSPRSRRMTCTSTMLADGEQTRPVVIRVIEDPRAAIGAGRPCQNAMRVVAADGRFVALGVSALVG